MRPVSRTVLRSGRGGQGEGQKDVADRWPLRRGRGTLGLSRPQPSSVQRPRIRPPQPKNHRKRVCSECDVSSAETNPDFSFGVHTVGKSNSESCRQVSGECRAQGSSRRNMEGHVELGQTVSRDVRSTKESCLPVSPREREHPRERASGSRFPGHSDFSSSC